MKLKVLLAILLTVSQGCMTPALLKAVSEAPPPERQSSKCSEASKRSEEQAEAQHPKGMPQPAKVAFLLPFLPLGVAIDLAIVGGCAPFFVVLSPLLLPALASRRGGHL